MASNADAVVEVEVSSYTFRVCSAERDGETVYQVVQIVDGEYCEESYETLSLEAALACLKHHMTGRDGYVKSFPELMSDELYRARAKFPDSHSNHEAYAVMLEEVHECWEYVKLNDPFIKGKPLLDELVQVAAMAQRWAEAEFQRPDMRVSQ